jgi:hypothetical protein
MSELEITTNISRSIKQVSDMFQNTPSAIWEYVVNGLQYNDSVKPTVNVSITSGARIRIKIEDNGHGMDLKDIAHFFTIHGENKDRKAGKNGRGKYGTGSFAAFSFAKRLEIKTVKNGKLTHVELSSSMINTSNKIQPAIKKNEVNTTRKNGTTITISEIKEERGQQIRINLEHLRRHIRTGLMNQNKNSCVYINKNPCIYLEPDSYKEKIIDTTDYPESKLNPGHKLTLKASRSPLSKDQIGITLFASGNWIASYKGESSFKEMGNFIFGVIDLPELDDDTAEIPFTDASRSHQLNEQHPNTPEIKKFLNNQIEDLRKELLAEKRKKQETNIDSELNKITQDMGRLFNNTLRIIAQNAEIKNQKTKNPVKKDNGEDKGENSKNTKSNQDEIIENNLSKEDKNKSDETSERDNNPDKNTQKDKQKEPKKDPNITSSTDGEINTTQKSRKTNDSFFKFTNGCFGSMTEKSFYDPCTQTININLDHPQIKIALQHGERSQEVKRVMYQAGSEGATYAIIYEQIEKNLILNARECLKMITQINDKMARTQISI